MYDVETYIIRTDVETYVLTFRDTGKFIKFCRECSRYGRSWGCPPYEYDTDEYLAGYKYAYIIGCKVIPSPEAASSPDVRAMESKIFADVRRRLDNILLGMEVAIPNGKAFFAGSCKFCEEDDCTRINGMQCRFPDKVRPSLEALGFDVVGTAKELLGIDICWGTGGRLAEYYTFTSGFFTVGDAGGIDRFFKEMQ